MCQNCNRKNPLARSGAHQDERYLNALAPESIALDERTSADLITFAQRFSHRLKYYTPANQFDGDWSPFFSNDIAAILAGLSQLPVTAFQQFGRALDEYLSTDNGKSEPLLSDHIKLFFHLPLLLLAEAGAFFEHLPIEHPFRSFIQEVVGRDLEAPLTKLISYYKGAFAPSILLFTDTPPDFSQYNTEFDNNNPGIQLPRSLSTRLMEAVRPEELALSAEFLTHVAGSSWAGPGGFYTTENIADTTPYESGGNSYQQIYDALNYNLLSKSVEAIFQGLERLRLQAEVELQEALTNFDQHPAHYGLWLAFLRLFENNQTQLNTLTGRHLDYYYKQVLQLCLKEPNPDHVHLIFELNKNQKDYLLSGGRTKFKAGKDLLGNNVIYQMDDDIVINQAKIKGLKSLHQKSAGGGLILPFAAPVTPSRDGYGAEFPKDHPNWKPFGPALGSPDARIGFALSDKALFLREGSRTIFITIQTQKKLPPALAASDLQKAFSAYLTGDEGWYKLPKAVEATVKGKKTLELKIFLDGEAPPIIPFDPSLHAGDETFNVDTPVVKIEFAFPSRTQSAIATYQLLRKTKFTSMSLQVSVSSVRNFSLQNEFGVLDTSKPFLPFGPQPEVNAPLILGSSEIFSKRLNKLDLILQWEQPLTQKFFDVKATENYQIEYSFLGQGTWNTTIPKIELFQTFRSPTEVEKAKNVNEILEVLETDFSSSSGSTRPIENKFKSNPSSTIKLSASNLGSLSQNVEQTLENSPYNSAARAGFIRFQLTRGFGHRQYIDDKTQALIDLANNKDAKIPDEPYTPKVIETGVSYGTIAAAPQRYFHLYPFGYKEEGSDSRALFPTLPKEGELYLGIADLQPPQRLSLLFQVLDGTANPLKGENDLEWHFLQGNEWVLLDSQSVDDKSDNLSASGVIGLAVPQEADLEHTLLPTGLHWLRMSVKRDADALNDLISIDPQAARATFIDQDNDLAFLTDPLPAGTISKLTVAQAAIKKIRQPYASFGGQPGESEDHFYTRASERLRHKDRAVSLWDYERLVLENFPKIYKVKCINHAELCRDKDNLILTDNELKPGHVLVVTLPYIYPDVAVDPLRPYTDKKTLLDIHRFLQARTSPFVGLEVVNLKLEEVKVKFQVAFTQDIDDINFYKAQLGEAIIRYLSPWAYAEGAEISFGGLWHKSAIINFIEEQSFVNYVKDFEMYHRPDLAADWSFVDQETIGTTSARSILVSAGEHTIEEIVPSSPIEAE